MLMWFFKVRLKSVLATIIIFITSLAIYVNYFITSESQQQRIPLIIWWTPFMLEVKKLINCENGKYQCILTKERKYRNDSNLAAYLFYGSNFDHNDLPLPRSNLTWAIFHEESPKNLAIFLNKEGQALFNITSTFSRHSDFPVPLQFLRDINLVTDETYYIPLAKKNMLLQNNAPVLYIQSDCDTPSERDEIVAELMKHIKIDSYGTCLNNKKLSKRYSIEKTFNDLYDEDLMRFVAQYKFIVAIENAICEDYVTEKLWRPLIAGAIPIYLGSPSIKDWLPNEKSAILIKDYENIAKLAEYIHKVNNNEYLYEQYMEHKILSNHEKISNRLLKSMLERGNYGIKGNTEFPIPAFECFVCKSIHEKFNMKQQADSVYDCEIPGLRNEKKENWWRTHWKIGGCQAKTLKYFVEIQKVGNFTKERFDKQLHMYLTNNEC